MFEWLLILLLCFANPSFEGRMTWYGEFFQGRPTASGEVYDVETASCAINQKLWLEEFACGYGRGECSKAWICKDKRCVEVVINDTGAFGHLLDCSPKVFEELGVDLDVGVVEVSMYTRQ